MDPCPWCQSAGSPPLSEDALLHAIAVLECELGLASADVKLLDAPPAGVPAAVFTYWQELLGLLDVVRVHRRTPLGPIGRPARA